MSSVSSSGSVGSADGNAGADLSFTSIISTRSSRRATTSVKYSSQDFGGSAFVESQEDADAGTFK